MFLLSSLIFPTSLHLSLSIEYSILSFSYLRSFLFARLFTQTGLALNSDPCSRTLIQHSAPSNLEPRSKATRSIAAKIYLSLLVQSPNQLLVSGRGPALCFLIRGRTPQLQICGKSTAGLLSIFAVLND